MPFASPRWAASRHARASASRSPRQARRAARRRCGARIPAAVLGSRAATRFAHSSRARASARRRPAARRRPLHPAARRAERPPESFARAGDLFRAERRAVRGSGAGLLRRAPADRRLRRDQRRPVAGSRFRERPVDGFRVLAVDATARQPEASKRLTWSVESESAVEPSMVMPLSSSTTTASPSTAPISLSDSTDQVKRFEASGWRAMRIDGHDPEAIDRALTEARTSDRPTLIAAKTTIG